MKIGLIRHFKVDAGYRRLLYNSEELNKKMSDYDVSPVHLNGLKINSSDWDICISSTLPRARETAKSIFNGKIIYSDLFIEVPITAFWKTKLKLPFFFWTTGARIAWYLNKSNQKETISDTKIRIDSAYKYLMNFEVDNILIITHGYFMLNLAKKLKLEGFIGKIDPVPANGKLYVYNNNHSNLKMRQSY